MSNPDGFMIKGVMYPAKSIRLEIAMSECIAELEQQLAERTEQKEAALRAYDKANTLSTEKGQQLAEHEYRWKWLNRSILEISKRGYSEWASVVLAVINKCRYEEIQGEGDE